MLREFSRGRKSGPLVILAFAVYSVSGQFRGQESTYVMDLIIALREAGWRLLDTYIWRKTTTVPGRATNKLKNGWEPFYHLAKQTKIKFCPDQVKRPAKPSSVARAKRMKGRDFTRRTSESGSGFSVYVSKATGGYANGGLALPDNVIECSPETRPYGKGHDSVFLEALPAFFINLLTRKGDVVLDPFSGSGTTAFVAQQMGWKFIAIDKEGKNIGLIQERLAQ